MKKTSKDRPQGIVLRRALAKVARNQERFWNAMSDFERLAGVDLNSTSDMTSYTDPTDADVKYILENELEGDGR